LHDLLEEIGSAPVRAWDGADVVCRKNQPSPRVGILIDQAFHRFRVIPAHFQKEGAKVVEIRDAGIERLPSRIMTMKKASRFQAPSAAAEEVPAGNFLHSRPGRTKGISECLERGFREHVVESPMIFEDCSLVHIGKCVPGMTMPEGMASQLVTQVDEFTEVLFLEHRPQMRLLPEKAKGHIIGSQSAISSQDRAGLDKCRPGKVIEGKRN
jgi:hypothetical protein